MEQTEHDRLSTRTATRLVAMLVALAMLAPLAIGVTATSAGASGDDCEVRGTTVPSGLPAHECDALLALYDSTNGRNWLPPWYGASWDTLVDPCTWTGVSCSGSSADKQRNVTQIQLSGRRLGGTLPPEIGNFSKLSELNLEYNSIGGHLPPELGNLSSLHLLWMKNNQFAGEIPAELSRLDNLWTLYLDNNNLEGELPPVLGTMKNLGFFYARGNQLEGEIPAEFGGLSSLRGLYISHNKLGGSIPPEITQLTAVNQIFLHNPSNCFKADKTTRLFLDPKLGSWQLPLVYC